MKRASLYICYFPTDEPLVHTQVLPYLSALASAGVITHLLTFEKRSRWQDGEAKRRRELKRDLAASGINWHALKYHKKPSVAATSFDIVAGALFCVWLVIRHRIMIVHARAHVPGVIGLAIKFVLRVQLIFDLRGLMAEEYVDNEVWREGSLPFRMAKTAEKTLLKNSDRIVVLTDRLKAAITDDPTAPVEAGKIYVIPCCTDLSLYPPADTNSKKSADALTLVYVGSLMGRYMLREMVAFFKVLKERRSAHFLIVTRANKSEVESVFIQHGIDQTSYSITSAEPRQVPALISCGDLAISFVKPSVAVLGMSPTKIGEYLAAGLPVVATRGGDTDSILESEKIGVAIDAFSVSDFAKAADEMLHMLDQDRVYERCREVARSRFSLAGVGAPRYLSLYRSLGCFGDAKPEHSPNDSVEFLVDSSATADASIRQKA